MPFTVQQRVPTVLIDKSSDETQHVGIQQVMGSPFGIQHVGIQQVMGLPFGIQHVVTPRVVTPRVVTPRVVTPRVVTPQGMIMQVGTHHDGTPIFGILQGGIQQVETHHGRTPRDKTPHGKTPHGKTPCDKTPHGKTPCDKTPHGGTHYGPMQTNHYPNGSRTEIYSNGTEIRYNVDGSRTEFYSNGTEIRYNVDGSSDHKECHGDTIVTFHRDPPNDRGLPNLCDCPNNNGPGHSGWRPIVPASRRR